MGLLKKKDGTATANTKKVMKMSEIMAYSFGLFGFQMIVGFLTSYQAAFLDKTFGASFLAVAIIIPIAKMVSAFADPFIGNLIDKTDNKLGKLKPFMIYSLLPLAVMTILIFVPFSGLKEAFADNKVALYAYIAAFYILWCVAMTIGDIPSQAMSAVLTPHDDERRNVISLSNTFKTVGMVMPAVVMPIVTMMIPGGQFFLSGNPEPWEYFAGAVAVTVIGLGCFSLIIFKNKERVPYKPEKTTLKDMGRALKDNKYLLIVFLTYMLGFGRMGAVAIPTQTAGALLGTESQSAIVGLSTAIGGMVSMVVTPILVKKFNEKRTFIGMSLFHFIMSAICMIVPYFTGFGELGGTSWQIIVVYVLLFFRALGCGAYYIIPLLLIADAVDYYEWKKGRRTEGVSYAVNSLAIKVTMALAAGISLLFVYISKYSNTMLDANNNIVVPFRTQYLVYFAFTGFPGIAYLLSCIPMIKYDLVGKKKQEMLEGLAQMRAENAGEVVLEGSENVEITKSDNSYQSVEETAPVEEVSSGDENKD